VSKPTRQGEAEGSNYTAADVRRAAGLSYRQLNDWEDKGVIAKARTDDSSWRKFSPRDIFALMVCKEIRERFGVPLEQLRWVRKFMTQEGADHLRAAITIMARGQSVLLLTDLTETFVMDSDLEIEGYIHLGYFRNENPQAYIVLKVNPLVNRLLLCLKDPIQLKIRDDFYAVVRSVRGELALRSTAELDVLQLIRDGQYRRVTIHLNDGRVEKADAESEHAVDSHAKLIDLLNREDFQTISVTKVDGKVIRVTQRKPIKFGPSASLRLEPPRQREPERRPGSQRG
jgi:DNA-binding transcriptional MerR regulator